MSQTFTFQPCERVLDGRKSDPEINHDKQIWNLAVLWFIFTGLNGKTPFEYNNLKLEK